MGQAGGRDADGFIHSPAVCRTQGAGGEAPSNQGQLPVSAMEERPLLNQLRIPLPGLLRNEKNFPGKTDYRKLTSGIHPWDKIKKGGAAWKGRAGESPTMHRSPRKTFSKRNHPKIQQVDTAPQQHPAPCWGPSNAPTLFTRRALVFEVLFVLSAHQTLPNPCHHQMKTQFCLATLREAMQTLGRGASGVISAEAIKLHVWGNKIKGRSVVSKQRL